MANPTLSYFLAPTWDVPPPPSGPIQLGNVLISLKTPERALLKAPALGDKGVFSTTQKEVSFSIEKLSEGRFGIFTRFLAAVVGLGIDAQVGWEVNDVSRFSFDRVETAQFVPEAEYIQSCINAEPVKRYLEKSRYRKPVYMITGIKTVSGMKAETLRLRGQNSTVSAEADATALAGAPLGLGPEIGGMRRAKTSASWETPEEILFAFRVRKILVRRKTGTVRKEEDYKRGALLDDAIEATSGPELEMTEQDIMDGDLEGFSIEELMDDGDSILCAVPTEKV